MNIFMRFEYLVSLIKIFVMSKLIVFKGHHG